MVDYSNTTPKRKATQDYSTRRQRRASVRHFAQQLELIKDAEEHVRDNTPENLQGSIVYEKAEEFVSLLEDAVEQLNSIY
jgi:hypothetical protein